MNKKLLTQVIKASYKDNNLDDKNVFAIAEHLSRKDLKQYIKALRKEEKKRTVYIDVFSKSINTEELKKSFPNKRLSINQDSTLLAGIRIKNGDDVYKLNIKDKLEDIAAHIAE